MKINFFCEFPEKVSTEQLAYLAELNTPSIVFVAARNWREFQNYSQKLTDQLKNHDHNYSIIFGYWPIIGKSYWLSNFSCKTDLKNLALELAEITPSTPVLFDLELPLLKKRLFLSGFKHYFGQQRNLTELWRLATARKLQIYTAEYPTLFPGFNFIKKVTGIVGDQQKFPHERIIMNYQSIIKAQLRIFQKQINSSLKDSSQIHWGIGVINQGVFTEPVLRTEELIESLEAGKLTKAKSVFIYGLEGLTLKYGGLLKNYAAI